jgi:hypothetical protein
MAVKSETKLEEIDFEVIDIGYGYVKRKASLTDDEVKKEKAVVAVLGQSLNSNQDLKGIDIINIDDVDYVVGDDVYKLGKKPITANEHTKRPLNIAYKVLALYAIAKSDNTNCERILFTGLPYQNLDEAHYIKEVFEKEHPIKLNGKDMTLNIVQSIVTSQGLGTYYTLVKQRGIEVLKKKILLVDLGFGTINYVPLNNGDIDAQTVKTNRDLGIQDAYKKIVDALNLEFKTNYKFYDVDDLLDNGVPLQDLEKGKTYEKINDRSYVKDALLTYATDVWNDIFDKYNTKFREDLDEIVFSGGTAQRVEPYIQEIKKHYCSTMEDSQNAQVLGYAEIAKKIEQESRKAAIQK